MAPTRSIAELWANGIIFRAEEAIAIVQQLIHTLPLDDCRIEPPYGPPSPDGVLVDELGAVTCRSCESTLGVSEVAILLQQLLPAGTPRVPGALRYMIARALHDVDAPPFDSVEEFSAGLARFERGDRAEVIRAMVARVSSAARHPGQAPDAREDRRQRMPTASDFRRELRAADARLYAQQVTLRALLPAPQQRLSPPPQTERRRTTAIGAGIFAGLILIAAGEVMHIRSTPAPAVEVAAPAQEVTTAPAPDREPAVRQAQTVSSSTRHEKVTSAAGAGKARATKVSLRRTSSSGSQTRGAPRAPGKMDRLHLGWLRNIVTVRNEPSKNSLP